MDALKLEQQTAAMDAMNRTNARLKFVRTVILMLMIVAMLVGAARIVMAIVSAPAGSGTGVANATVQPTAGELREQVLLRHGPEDASANPALQPDGSARSDLSSTISALLSAANDADANSTEQAAPTVDEAATQQAEATLERADQTFETYDYAAAAVMYERVIDMPNIATFVRERARTDYARCLVYSAVAGRASKLSERYQSVRFETTYGVAYEGYVDKNINLTVRPLPPRASLVTFDGRLLDLPLTGLTVKFLSDTDVAVRMGQRVRRVIDANTVKRELKVLSPLDEVDLAVLLLSCDRIVDDKGASPDVAEVAHKAISAALVLDPYLMDTLLMRDDAAFVRMLQELRESSGQITPTITRLRDELFSRRPNAWFFQGDPERLFVVLKREIDAIVERTGGGTNNGVSGADETTDPGVDQFRRDNEDAGANEFLDAGQQRYDTAVEWDRQTLPDGRRSDEQIEENLARAISEYLAAIELWQSALQKLKDAGASTREIENKLVQARRGLYSARKRKRI